MTRTRRSTATAPDPVALARPVIVGVTGGIGAGKSTAVEAFVRHGAAAFSADSVVHALYSDGEVIDAVTRRWGDAVLDPKGGSVRRAAVADIVFRDAAERRWLEALLHPRVGREWEQFIAEHREAHEPPDIVVAEVPLLYEAGLQDRYDVVVAITAPLETRMQRLVTRSGARSLGAERAATQLPDDEKARRADFAFANTGSPAQLDAFVEQVLRAVGCMA